MKSQFRCCRRSPRSSLWPATVSASIATATRRNGRRNYPIRFKGRTVSGNAPTIPAPNAQNASVAKAATPALNTKHGRCCRHVVKNSSYRIPLPSGADWKWSRSSPRVNGFGPTMVCDSFLCELCVLNPDPPDPRHWYDLVHLGQVGGVRAPGHVGRSVRVGRTCIYVRLYYYIRHIHLNTLACLAALRTFPGSQSCVQNNPGKSK